MPFVTVSGATGTNVVTTLQVTTASTTIIAKAAADSISTLFPGFGQANINSGSYGTAPIVGSIGGTSTGNVGTIVDQNIPNNVQALLINNTGDTFASNSRFIGSETVLSSVGNLNFTDNGSSTTIVTGGGNNTITFSTYSTNGTFQGDGNNQIGINSLGTTSVFGTAGSSDTIFGSASVSSSIVYKAAAGATAFIDPRNANVTVFGASGAGTETVFGGTGADAFTGKLTVTDGTGFFAGGSAGGNSLGSSTVGSTTLVGGGSGDILSAKGVGDRLVAGVGAETLDGSNAAGGDFFFASSNGSSLMYAGKTVGDTFYTNTQTATGTAPVLALMNFIDLHTGPNTLNGSLNSGVSSTIAVGFSNNGANFATVGDFVSGLDKIVLKDSVVGAANLAYGTVSGASGPVAYTNLTTANGSLITFYNAHVVQNDISKV